MASRATKQGKAPGCEFQRQMILHSRLGDIEAEYLDVQEWSLREHDAHGTKTIAHIKYRLIAANTGASYLKCAILSQRAGCPTATATACNEIFLAPSVM